MEETQSAIQRLKRGDMDGLETLVARYQVQAVRVAFLITQDESLAQDVVQDTFLRIYQRIRYFDESLPFEPYLYKSVMHAALNVARRAARFQSLDDDLSGVENLLEHSVSAESQVEAGELSKQILLALSRLSTRQRLVIVQRYYLEMSEKEMSEALQVAPGTVKWLLNAARMRLRNLLRLERKVL